MKNLSKFLLASVLSSMIGFGAKAQSNANADITTQAVVLSALTITKNTDVSFGNISQTTAGVVFLDPTGVTSNYVSASAHTGKLTIGAANSTIVKLIWPVSLSLSDGASHNLNYDLSLFGKITDSQSASATLNGTPGTANVTTSGSGAYYIYVGGSLGGVSGTPAALSNQATGTYTGTANIMAEYN